MITKKILAAIPIAIVFLTAGCTTQVNHYMDFETRQFSPLKEKYSSKTVFINSITDNRQFIEAETTIQPETQSISSYTPDKNDTKGRIIARNQTISPCTEEKSVANCTANSKSYSALGENLCFKEKSSKEYVKLAIEKGFEDAGYKVLSHSSDVTETSLVIDVSLERFWYWLDYQDTDRVAYNEIISSFKVYDKKTNKTKTFKISNTTTMEVLDFMNPLKGTVGNSLVEYARIVTNNINKLID